MNHGALEAELGDAAFELVGGRLGVGGRQRGEAGEALRVGLAGPMQPVVDAAGHVDGDAGVEALRRRRVVREHLDVDAGLVHLLDAHVGEVLQPRHRRPAESRA